ncbi:MULTISPECIES: hypothetical protein [unclassified Microcoleus]|uniref:hypothetical protein n=1 Tax=unclassified Microcoleus TaxID=2642155 RepID=UPI002FD1EFFA
MFQLPVLPEFLIQLGDYQAISAALEGMAVDKNTFSPSDIEAYKDAAAKRGALTATINILPQSSWRISRSPQLEGSASSDADGLGRK